MERMNLFSKKERCYLSVFCYLFFTLCFFPNGIVAQQSEANKFTVMGTVYDERKEPLIGANVSEKGFATNGVSTDMDGKFVLQVSNPNAILHVSYIGYESRDVPIKGSSQLSIILAEDQEILSEVVVVGYGVQKKASLTGAITAVTSSDIITTRNENVQNMLTGKLPGVRVMQKSSEPGAFSNNFDIRGLGTPLIIIDGIPRGHIDRLDANDIESISVLKDASAAVYGVRAANGVVLITTKRGSKGAATLEYSGNFGWQHPSGSVKSTNATDFMTLRNEKMMNNVNGGTLPFTDEDFNAYYNGTKRSTSWWDETLRDWAPQSQHSLNITGGTEAVNYYVSGGFMEQESFFKKNDLKYNRFNIRSNISAQINKYLSVDMNVDGIYDRKSQPYTNSDWILRAMQRAPSIDQVYANNNPEYLKYGMIEGDNPVALSDKSVVGYKQYRKKFFQSSMALTYVIPFIEGLKAKVLYSYDYQSDDNDLYKKAHNLYLYDEASDEYEAKGMASPGEYKKEHFSKENKLYQFSLSYNKTFNNDHNLNALLLYEGAERRGDNIYAQRELSIDLDQLFAGNTEKQIGNQYTGSNDLFTRTNIGIVGKIGYDFQSKYLLDVNFRQDGSSYFQKGKRWGFFPSASIGWRVSEEAFWKNAAINVINNLKIRTSYGKVGDDGDAAYQWLQGYTYPAGGDNNKLPGGYFFDGQFINASASKGIINPDITWYEAKTFNLGLDMEAWNGLAGITFDFFTRYRTGLLTSRAASLPGVVGADLPKENLNSDFTRGFEIELSHRNQFSLMNDDLRYGVKGWVSVTRTKKHHDERSRAGNSYENWKNNNQNRYLGLHWGYADGGRFNSYEQIANSNVYYGRSTLPGDYIYVDWNGDGIINHLDSHPFAFEQGKTPFLSYSFTLNADWKGFDVNALFQGTGMGSIKYVEQLREPMWGNDNSSALTYFMDRWHPENPKVDPFDHTTQWIRGKYAYTGHLSDENSEFNVRSTDYLRLKTLEIGYTLPKHLITKIGVQNIRIYANAYNLFTISDLEMDPEHTSENYGNTYPLNKTYSIGLNVKF